jgi:hypothetical protein
MSKNLVVPLIQVSWVELIDSAIILEIKKSTLTLQKAF